MIELRHIEYEAVLVVTVHVNQPVYGEAHALCGGDELYCSLPYERVN